MQSARKSVHPYTRQQTEAQRRPNKISGLHQILDWRVACEESFATAQPLTSKRMKTPLLKSLAFGGLALATAALLPSCVDPYSPGPQAVTTYRTGYEVRSLPPGYRTETIEGSRYYSYNGTYYRSHSGRYVVVDAPRHHDRPGPRRDVVITRLPNGYRTMDRHGVRYYQANGNYYQKRGSGYVIVSRPY
jgi:hypothetical protein